MNASVLLRLALLSLFIVTGYFITAKFFPEGFDISVVRESVLSLGALAPLIFIGIYALSIVLFLPAAPFSLLSGALFGPWWGTLYILVAATTGSILAFLLSRIVGRDLALRLLGRHKERVSEYDARVSKEGLRAVLLLRLIPVVPFNALNLVLGLTSIRLRDYALGTAIGIIPGAFVFAYAGSAAAEPSASTLFIAILAFALLLSIGPIYRRYGKR